MQRHLSGYVWQRLHQEVGCSHPGLDRSERMLDRLTPLAHFFWMLVEPALNGFENLLMLPTRDPSLLAGCNYNMTRSDEDMSALLEAAFLVRSTHLPI